jgi:glycerate dehydrogenase
MFTNKPELGVFLDLETVDTGDLDRSRLQSSLPRWQWHEFSDSEDIQQRIAQANVVVSNKCTLDRSVMRQAAKLQLIAVAATGTNNVDLKAAAELGIIVCNIRDYASDAVAQHVITSMLNLLTHQPDYLQDVRQGAWSRSRQFCLNHRPIRQARDLSFGVIGYGVLGRATGKLAENLGMKLLVAERQGETVREGRLPFEEVIARADVISLHCPLSAATRGLIDQAVLQDMKPEALLINTARGGVIVGEDLANALRQGVIAGAAVDTLSQEPPPVDHILLAADIPNLLITPHNAWASKSARQAALDQLADVISAFVEGPALNPV